MPGYYLVHTLPSGQRIWFVGTEHRMIGNVPVDFPLFDDARGKEVSYEFAASAKERWARDPKIRIQVYIAPHERYAQFLEEHEASSDGEDHRVPMFVFVKGDELGYYVHPATRPDGRSWYMKFTHPSLSEQTVYGNSPEHVVAKARAMGFLEIEKPQDSPFKAQQAAQRELEQKQKEIADRHQRTGRLRPGSFN